MGEGGWYYVPKVGSAESRWEYGDPFLIDTTAGASTEVCGEPKRKRREESFELGRTKGLLPLSHVTTLKKETNAAPLFFFSFSCLGIFLDSSAAVTPTQVWTPYGGWWANPKHWKRNTGFAGVGIATAAIFLFRVGCEVERRPVAPYKHIPSQRWCKHAKIDDPSLWRRRKHTHAQIEESKKNIRIFFLKVTVWIIVFWKKKQNEMETQPFFA